MQCCLAACNNSKGRGCKLATFQEKKTLLSACSRFHNQTNVLFAPSLLKIRARRFVLCLCPHNCFEQEIKNALFFAQFTYVSRSYVLVCTWKNDHATRLLQAVRINHASVNQHEVSPFSRYGSSSEKLKLRGKLYWLHGTWRLEEWE